MSSASAGRSLVCCGCYFVFLYWAAQFGAQQVGWLDGKMEVPQLKEVSNLVSPVTKDALWGINAPVPKCCALTLITPADNLYLLI